jgi:glycosyltransferase involved in cell wall biosynthesis
MLKKILLITSEAGSRIAGDSQSAMNFAYELDKMGVKCSVISCTKNPISYKPNSNTSFYSLPYTGSLLSKITARIILFLLLFRVGLRHKYWIIYGKTLGNRITIILGYILKRKAIFRSTLAGFDDIKELTSHPFNKYIYKKIKGYWALNQWFVDSFNSTIRLNQNRIFLSPQGVTNIFYTVSEFDKKNIRTKLGLPKSFPIIVMVGHLINRKGFPEIFNWYNELQKDFQLIIVGNYFPAKESRLNRYYNELQNNYNLGKSILGNKILFTDQVSNVYEYLQSADIFVHAAYAEGFPPNALNEAMACGLPCVVRTIDGVDRCYTEKRAAIFFRNKEDFLVNLKKLIDDDDFRTFYANNAKGFADKALSINVIAQNFINYTNKL